MSGPSPLVADPGSLQALQQAVEEGRTDPVRLLEKSLARIEAAEQQVQSFCWIGREGAIRQAQQLKSEAAGGEMRGPLHGIPVAIKDVIDVAGLPTKAGSPTRANVAPAAIDASLVSRLRAAGA
ncbi:MAG TPA: amidase family protein, partial [Xanthobacteraceae bacterium]|nr:amidase family protein [Xanthobacteraceae bacterium]